MTLAFEPDSSLVDGVVPARGFQRGLFKERREYGAVVTHQTGIGALRRATSDEARFRRWRRRWLPDSEALTYGRICAAIYESVMDPCGHYVVGPDGDSWQTCPEHLSAWHVGTSKYSARPYRWSRWMDERTDWWLDRWERFDYGSPLDLAEGRLWGPGPKYSANMGAVAVEFAWPYDAARTPPTDQQWQAWSLLTRDICERREIPLDVRYLPNHSDTHPRARTSRGAPYDCPPWFNPSTVSYWLGITSGPPEAE